MNAHKRLVPIAAMIGLAASALVVAQPPGPQEFESSAEHCAYLQDHYEGGVAGQGGQCR